MPVEVILPKVDMDMTHGTLAVWHAAEGDLVTKGAALFDIETDKAAMEVEAPATGRLRHVSAKAGDRVPVGSTVAWLYAEGEAAVAGRPPEPLPEKATEPTAPPRPAAGQDDAAPPVPGPEVAPERDAPAATPATESGTLRATPAARAAARQAGFALVDVPGSGPLGRIQRDDVAEALRGRDDRQAPAAAWSPQPGPLHVSRRSGAGTPVLLIHGFTADSLSWAPLEKALGPARPLLRIDLPGHGRSPRRRVAGFSDLARMIVEAFDDATRSTGPVHLVGHSLGAALAAAIADIRAPRVAGLTLIAPAGLGPEIDAAALNGIVRATRAESLAPWLRRLTATPDGISDDYARAAMRPRADPALRAVQADMADALFPDGVQAFDLRPAIARLSCPAQIIWGRQDHILPHRQALAADGDFAFHFLSGVGHIPQVEAPGRVAAIIARQIAAVEAASPGG